MNVKRINRIVSMLYEEMRTLSDEGRDLPVRWNVMHMYSCAQIAKLLALSRGMDLEIAAIAAALHDIAVIRTKSSENHAELAEEYVRNVVAEYNKGPWTKLPKITKEEEDFLIHAIAKHSDKETISDDPSVELLKDVDCLDRWLHGIKTEGAYLQRCKNALSDLGMDPDTIEF